MTALFIIVFVDFNLHLDLQNTNFILYSVSPHCMEFFFS